MAMASVVGCSSFSLPLLKAATKTILFAGKMSFSLNSNTVSNGSRITCMQVLNPHTNLKFETLSYLPPLSPDQIAKQVDYIVANGWIPCLEFDKIGTIAKTNFQGSGYYDHRYWTMWKLPMFGCKESAKVFSEIEECKEAYPQCFVRLLGFDPKRQVQVIGFLVQKPSS